MYNTKTEHNSEKANNTKHSKTKLAWFSLALYRINFFPIRPEPDFAGFGMTTGRSRNQSRIFKLTVILLI